MPFLASSLLDNIVVTEPAKGRKWIYKGQRGKFKETKKVSEQIDVNFLILLKIHNISLPC